MPTARFGPAACYVVTGGLGGLGRSIVKWMVARGARHLVLLSRRPLAAASPSAQRLVAGLTADGVVDVRAVVCDVADRAQVERVLDDDVTALGWPVRGVVHTAVAWRDVSFVKVTTERRRWRGRGTYTRRC